MKTKMVLGISLAAVFAVSMIAAQQAMAGVAEGGDLIGGSISDGVIKFTTFQDPIPRHGEVFGGFGVLTDGTLLVVTSHRGFYDSESQIPRAVDTFASPFVEICHGSDLPSCGPEWHTHLANLVPARDGSNCTASPGSGLPALEIAALTYENPTEVDVIGNKIFLSKIKQTGKFTESITGLTQIFGMGNTTGDLLKFNIRADAGVNPPAFCVEDVVAVNVAP